MKIIKIVQEIIKLHKIGFPNTSSKKQYLIDVLNLWYSLKNILGNERKVIQHSNLNLTDMWSKLNAYIDFQNKYYSTKDYLNAPVVRYTTGGFHSKNPLKFKTVDKNQKHSIETISFKLEKIFSTVPYNQWHNSIQFFLEILNNFKESKIDLYSKLKDLTIVEFGPGTGISSLLYQSISGHTFACYDLPQMQTIQKFVHKKYFKNAPEKLNKFNYFTNLQGLEKFLKGRKFCFISNFAFSETSLSLRLEFEEILSRSEFALFSSNKIMSGVDNFEYFDTLSERLLNHTYLNTHFNNIENLQGFQKRHKIHLFNKNI